MTELTSDPRSIFILRLIPSLIIASDIPRIRIVVIPCFQIVLTELLVQLSIEVSTWSYRLFHQIYGDSGRFVLHLRKSDAIFLLKPYR